MRKRMLIVLLGFISFSGAFAQKANYSNFTNKLTNPSLALKSNLLYLATTTPNWGLELSLAKNWTIETTFVHNSWDFSGNTSFRHWLIQSELRYWICQSFEGHFLGLNAIYANYNVGEISFIPALKEYTYKGDLYGAGFSYGYHVPIGGKWGLELTAGLGWIHLNYDKYQCQDCREYQGSYKRNYFGPTKAGISLIYLLN